MRSEEYSTSCALFLPVREMVAKCLLVPNQAYKVDKMRLVVARRFCGVTTGHFRSQTSTETG